MEDLFQRFWWLMFPIFGMVMAVWGMIQDDRRTRSTIDLVRTYVQQGKEPPPELLKIAAKESDYSDWGMGRSSSNGSSRAWTFVTFAALAAGFGVGYWWVREEGFAYAFLIVAVTMGVLALGALAILLSGRK